MTSFMAKVTIDESEIDEGKKGFHLNIDLANGFSIAIGMWPDVQEHPECELVNHTANGHDPAYMGFEEFKEWAEIAIGKQPLKNFGRYRECPDCGKSYHDVPEAPVLIDEIWLKLARRDECLCVACLQKRAREHKITLTIESLRPCPINIQYLEYWIKREKRLPPNADQWRKAFAAVKMHSKLLDSAAALPGSEAPA